ncbi:pentatricopeptide repeat-containing protein mitochondrial [Dorcoceras hygrometricum]|uniref:Pentatricopeptide repeat-containing protein mitochondrial n=1 Tax=Dorcoceras hygrometricum TaxID=472368 RepID=A0A2Z7CBM9_9LAMI|nr:pentatricopeptide repeat-containing protein mitochondrial [Dorcoceras hygrometricum]
MNPAEARFSARFLKRCRLREFCWWLCVRVSAGCSAGVDVNAGQLFCSSKRKRRRFVVATGSPAAIATLRFDVATGTSREKRCIVLFLRLDTQLLVWYPVRSRLGKLARRHFENQPLVLASAGNPGSTAGRGFNPAGGAPGGG